MRRVLTTAATLLITLASATGAAAAPPWSAPVSLSQSGERVFDVELATGAAGEAFVVWERNSVIQASLHSPGGSFGAPIPLSDFGERGSFPLVAANGAGDALVVWHENSSDLRFAAHPAGGSLSPAADLTPFESFRSKPQIAVGASGEAIAGWAASNGVNAIARAAIRPAGGAFANRVDLSAPGQDATAPQFAISASGDAVAVWTRSNGTHTIVQAAIRAAGGRFLPVDDLSLPGQNAVDPHVAIDAAGNAVAVWTRSNGTHTIVQAAIRAAGGRFLPVDDLSLPGQNAVDPHVAIDAAGNAVAVWRRATPTPSAFVIQAAIRPAGGSFDRPVDLTDARGSRVVKPQIAAGAGGNAVAVWGNEGSGIVEAAMRLAGGSFGPPVELSDPSERPGNIATDARVAIDPEGNAVAAWQRTDGVNRIAQTAALDLAPPRLSDVSVPAGGTVGASLAFAASAFDTWSPPVALAWSFGDGTGATGDGVSHAFASPGTYEVRVTATDAAGRAATATRQITIAAAPGRRGDRPVLSGLRLSPVRFRAAARGASIARGRAPTPSRVRYRLDRAATVTFTVERQAAGRRAAGRCVRPTQRNRRARACTRYVTVRGSFTRNSTTAENAFTFTGRLRGRKLQPGRYRLVATPTANGARGASARVAFRILAAARAKPRPPVGG